MEAKYFWRVYQRELINGFFVMFYGLALWNTVAFVKGKLVVKHVISKPNL